MLRLKTTGQICPDKLVFSVRTKYSVFAVRTNKSLVRTNPDKSVFSVRTEYLIQQKYWTNCRDEHLFCPDKINVVGQILPKVAFCPDKHYSVRTNCDWSGQNRDLSPSFFTVVRTNRSLSGQNQLNDIISNRKVPGKNYWTKITDW